MDQGGEGAFINVSDNVQHRAHPIDRFECRIEMEGCRWPGLPPLGRPCRQSAMSEGKRDSVVAPQRRNNQTSRFTLGPPFPSEQTKCTKQLK